MPPASDPALQALAVRALDAARSAGAHYADVRFTRTQRRALEGQHQWNTALAVGVRALAGGAWGFAAGTTWTPEMVALLGQQAAAQAKGLAWSTVPPVTLGDRLPAMTGQWETPIQRDPFAVSDEENHHHVRSLVDTGQALNAGIGLTIIFERQARTFASTEGAMVTQTVSTAFAGLPHYGSDTGSYLQIQVAGSDYYVPWVSPMGAGYEVVEELHRRLPEWVATAREMATHDVFQALGAYEVVLDADAMAAVVSATCGTALQYDRAVGVEANATGTSYLAPPSRVLGSPWAPSMVTILADRTLPHGAATVRWDDDGVSPHPTPLVKDGIIVDYATSRECVPELSSWYTQRGLPAQSNGSAASESALTLPLVHTPNLVLQPGTAGTSVDTLVNGVEHGYFICGGELTMDQQQLTGHSGWFRHGLVNARTIRHGKVGPVVKQVLLTIKSPDFWRHVVALGGPETATPRGLWSTKGQPNQQTMHTVQAVPALVRNVTLRNVDQI